MSDARVGLRYEPALDGLRAAAVVLVFLHHAGFPRIAGGFEGVTVFFVLSGFLITTLLLSELAEHGSIRLRSFYARRALRLFPALFVFLAFLVVWAFVGEDDTNGPQLLRDVLATFGYVQNISLGLRHGDAEWGLLGHAWSLSVEEQFYLLWPFALVALTRWTAPISRKVGLVLVVAAASAAWRAGLGTLHSDLRWPHVSLDARCDALLLGCALGLAMSGGLVPSGPPRRSWMLSGAGLGAAGVLGLWVAKGETGERSALYVGYLLVAVCTVVIIFDVMRQPRSPARVLLSWPPLVALGRISYAFYLWHFFVVVWFRGHWGWSASGYTVKYLVFLVVAFATSTALAATSMQLVERPFLRRKQRFSRRVPASLVAAS